MTADVEVSYRLDRTLAGLERFVNEMLITKLPPIRHYGSAKPADDAMLQNRAAMPATANRTTPAGRPHHRTDTCFALGRLTAGRSGGCRTDVTGPAAEPCIRPGQAAARPMRRR